MVRSVESGPSMRSIVGSLWRHKGKMLLCFALVLAATLGVTAIMQPAYRSEAKLFVRLGRENSMLDPTATIGAGPLVVVPHSREEEINSVCEILKSRVLLDKIVDEFGPAVILGTTTNLEQRATAVDSEKIAADAANAAPPSTWEFWWKRIGPDEPGTPHDAALGKLQRRLTVAPTKKSNMISLHYDGPSPQVARAVVTRLVELYLDQHVHLNRAPDSHLFFNDQAEELRNRLGETEEKLRSVKDATGVASAPEQQTILVTRIGELEDQHLAALAELTVSRAEMEALEKRLTDLPEFLEKERVAGYSNEAADGMKQQLFSLQLREQDLLSKFKEETFQIREIRRQIAEAQKILDQEEEKRTQVTTGMNRAHEETQLAILDRRTQVASLQAKADALASQLQTARADLRKLNSDSLTIARLQRDLDLQDAHFRTYARNLEQARIDQALELQRISNISLVQPATMDSRPVRPNKPMNLAMGLLAAVLTSVGLGLLADHFDQTLRTAEDVERQLGVPALVSIPRAARRPMHPNGKSNSDAHAIPR